MSMYAHCYTIFGYDLTRYVIRDFDEWAFSNEKEYEAYTCNQVVENIQLFTDPCGGKHVFLGYIVSMYDTSCECDEVYVTAWWELAHKAIAVDDILDDLIDIGVIDEKAAECDMCGLYSFVEYK